MAMKFKRNKKTFNGMDLFFILAVAIVAVAVLFVLRGMKKNPAATNESGVTIEYTVEFKQLDSSVIGFVKEGDLVKDPDTKQNIGTVVSVQSVPFSKIAYNADDGSVFMADHPDVYDLLITIRAEATHTDSGYYTGGARFLVGKTSNIWSRGFAGTGYCISIREID